MCSGLLGRRVSLSRRQSRDKPEDWDWCISGLLYRELLLALPKIIVYAWENNRFYKDYFIGDPEQALLDSDVHIPEDVVIERTVKEGLIAATKDQITIALDTKLSDALIREGMAREIVNKLNTQRRNENFEVTDRIIVRIDTTSKVRKCFDEYEDTICHETLATEVKFEKTDGTEWDLNGEKAIISIQKH